MDTSSFDTKVDTKNLAEDYLLVRRFSEELASPLSSEDCTIQSMPDVSPTKWHLAHTTWFFETFLLSNLPGYQVFDASFNYLFNSYYNTIGKQFPRPQRGLISRPGLEETLEYRRHVDDHMAQLLVTSEVLNQSVQEVVATGLNHEQQHQELMLTDIKHVLSCNPLHPQYRSGQATENPRLRSQDWLEFEEGVYWVGHDGDDFHFDNESPRHRQFLESFFLAEQPVTSGEYLRFMEDGGYQRPELWLSLGWSTVCEEGWQAPLYWQKKDDQWHEFTLTGLRPVDPTLPVCHVSYFEADAFARWAGARLPTEVEWEVAATEVPLEGSFVDLLWDSDRAIHPGSMPMATSPLALFGDVWEWTSSSYGAYPGYTPADGALGEYNGKFMCNQFVLRGGSCATSSNHMRKTYRNFFPPDARWQFSGIRLCK